VFIQEDGGGGGGDAEQEQQEADELQQAIDETLAQLESVPGISRVSAARNELGEPIILIVAGQGFRQASLRAIPNSVSRFSTVVALPYDMLPLKRDL
jgi:hypothetical protein